MRAWERRVRNAVNPMSSAISHWWCHSALRDAFLRRKRTWLAPKRRCPAGLPEPQSGASPRLPPGCPDGMSTADDANCRELVVADDGSIPAEQLRGLGLRPGTHFRVIETGAASASTPMAGSLPEFPDASWEDLERASEAARRDAEGS